MSETEAKKIQRRWDSLDVSWKEIQTDAQRIYEHCLPRYADISAETSDRLNYTSELEDPIGIEACQISAQGQYDLIFSGDFLGAEPSWSNPSDNEKKIYNTIGQRMLRRIQGSNFGVIMQQTLLDRTIGATGVIFAEEEDADIVFKTKRFGKFRIAENSKGSCNTLMFNFQLDAEQAVGEYGKEALPKEILQCYEKGDLKKFEFLKEIRENIDREKGKEDSKNKLFKSTTIVKGITGSDGQSCHVVKESGYDEQSFIVTRFSKYGDSPWGYGPMWAQLPNLMAIQEVRGDITGYRDLAINRAPALPDELDQSDYDPRKPLMLSIEARQAGFPFYPTLDPFAEEAAVRELEELRNRVRSAAMVPLFELFTSMEERSREKTAYEASLMLDEKISNSNATFNSLIEDVKVLFYRVFAMMSRLGEFDDLGLDKIPAPKITFTSKLSSAQKAIKLNKFISYMQTMGPWLQQFPESAANIDQHFPARQIWMDMNLWPEGLVDQEEVDAAIERSRGDQDLQRGVETAKTATDAVGNLM